MTIARVRTVMTGTSIVGGGVCDLYFNGSTGAEDAMCGAVRDFWDAIKSGIRSGTEILVEPEVFNLDETDGSVVSIATVSPAPTVVTGTGSDDPLPPATQALMRWSTDGVVANRRVRGRTFIPAQGEGGNTGGVPNSAARALYDGAAAALIADPDCIFVIWSRPTPSRPGSQHIVLAGSTWNQYAVLRSRRD